MQFKLFKIIFILSLILYHSVSISKAAISNNFNQKYLSNYFSGLVSYDNQDNDLALKFFESSKALIKKHPSYLKQYVFSLVLDGQIAKATKQINFWKNNINSNFFEAKLLLVIDSISKKVGIVANQFNDFNIEVRGTGAFFKNHNESFFNIIQKRFEWDF